VLTFFQPTWQRFVVSSVFSWACLIHSVIEIKDDSLYYFSAGMVDLVLIVGFSFLAMKNKFTFHMMIICFSALGFNFLGYLFYEYEILYGAYTALMFMVYSAAILLFRGKDKENEHENNTWVHLPYSKCLNLYNSLFKKAGL
jgi:hypothetical protein